MPRRNFTRAVYAQIAKRAMNAAGEIVCEGCGLVLGKKPYHVDHTIADGLHVDKSWKLTAKDGKLLGVECCHKPKTKADVGDIAKAKAREAKDLGIKKLARRPIQSRGFPTRKSRVPKPPLAPKQLYAKQERL